MPTYDYRCTQCGHVFEKFHAINFSEEVICPLCNATAKKKITAGTGLIFKGSGFYITDYKNSSSKTDSSTSSAQTDLK